MVKEFCLIDKEFEIIDGGIMRVFEKQDVKQFIKELKKKLFLGGCGEEFLNGSGEWEMMCGKHIWKSPGVVAEYRLCENCLEGIKLINKLSGDGLLGSGEQ